ncbi:RxLR effector protein [Phytophthora megakarya]|uniref:RxLR effector protein n=1 Tax=Phytophthora megakarya TaxID=4795 RepID=A0A225WCA3_9STRA|nr:RxLR effector protein [Phytophthora megakarya]
MSSPRRIPWPKFIVWWTAVTLLISYVGAQLEENAAGVDIPQLATVCSTYYGEKSAPTTRVLRGTGSDMDNDVMNNEERGYLLKGVKKFVHKPAITATLAISLLIRDSPAKVLTRFRQRGISMKEDSLLPWLGYVKSTEANSATRPPTTHMFWLQPEGQSRWVSHLSSLTLH